MGHVHIFVRTARDKLDILPDLHQHEQAARQQSFA
jgi:hypothetical protein